MSGRLKDFVSGRRGTSGSVAAIFGICASVTIGIGGFALDMGLAQMRRDRLQNAADQAAQEAAQTTVDREATVRRVLDAFGLRDATFRLQSGLYVGANDRDVRFVVGKGDDAVRVVARTTSPTFLARIYRRDDFQIQVVADARVKPTAAIAVGGRLAAVDPTLLEAVVGPATGLDLGLTVMDWRGLAKAKVEMGGVFASLPNWRHMPVASALATQVDASVVLANVADALDRSGDPAARPTRTLARAAQRDGRKVRIGDVIAVGRDGAGADVDRLTEVAGFEMDVLDVVKASLGDGGTAKDAVKSSLVVPGLAKVDLEVLSGEPMVDAAGPVGTVARTAQLRLRATVATTGLAAALGIEARLPVEVVVAGGSAEISRLTCGATAAERSVELRVSPGIFRASVGRWTKPLALAALDDRLDPVTVLDLGLTKVTGNANLTGVQTKPVTMTFKGNEIGGDRIRTASTRTMIGSVLSSLLSQVDLEVQAVGLSLPLPVLPRTEDFLERLADPLDATLSTAMGVAGTQLGQLDVRVDGLACGKARIVG